MNTYTIWHGPEPNNFSNRRKNKFCTEVGQNIIETFRKYPSSFFEAAADSSYFKQRHIYWGFEHENF